MFGCSVVALCLVPPPPNKRQTGETFVVVFVSFGGEVVGGWGEGRPIAVFKSDLLASGLLPILALVWSWPAGAGKRRVMGMWLKSSGWSRKASETRGNPRRRGTGTAGPSGAGGPGR